MAQIGIVTVVVGSLILFWHQVQTQLTEQAQQGAALIDDYVQNVEADINTIAKYIATTTNPTLVFRSTLVQNPVLQGIFLVRPDGRVLEQQHRVVMSPLSQINDQPWLDRVIRGETYVGLPQFDAQPLPYLMLAVAVPDAAGHFAHSLVARVELTKLWTQLNNIRVGENGRVFALSQSSRVALHHKLSVLRTAQTFSSLYPVALSWHAHNSVGAYADQNGQVNLILSVPSARTGLSAVAQKPFADMAVGLMALVIILTLGVASAMWFVWQAKRFTRVEIVGPLALLSHSAGEFALGNMAHRTGVVGRYELADISTSLDQMAQRLSATLGDLHQRVTELDESIKFSQAILDSESGHIAVLDSKGCIVQTNAAWKRCSFHDRDDLCKIASHPDVGNSYLSLCHVGQSPHGHDGEASEGIHAVLEGLLPMFTLEYPCHTPHENRWFTLTVTPLGSGRKGAVVVHNDITVRRQSEETQAKTLEFLRKIADSVPGVMYQYRLPVNGKAHFPYISPRVHIFGLSPDVLLQDAEPLFDRVHTDDTQAFRDSLVESSASLSIWRSQFRISQAHGGFHWFEGQAVPEVDADGSIVWFGYFSDIQFQKDTEERIRIMALHDALTGLPNRALLDDRVSNALTVCRREKTRFGLMFIDLDKFKPVNDHYGHSVGDLLLKDVAKRLRHGVRESDTPARLGGDEFVVLLRHVKQHEDVLVVAEKVHVALHEPFLIEGLHVDISASIGLAIYPDHGHDALELTQRADAAMYRAKETGRNGVAMAKLV